MVDKLGVFQWSGDSILQIFQKHFVVRHCLYTLQSEIHTDRAPSYTLNISATKIRLVPVIQDVGNQAINTDSSAHLAAFYLDLANYQRATAENVSALLASFWSKFHAYEDRDAHLKVLGLEAGASWKQIQSRYRELVAQQHPDKGGNPRDFIHIREAFEALKKLKGPG